MSEIRLKNTGFVEALKIMASSPDVKNAILNSYDVNPWWPNDISDWRMRMIIAGLSTRVSFRMMQTYIKVINRIKALEYGDFINASDQQILEIIKPLGLSNNRIIYIRSMIKYLESKDLDLNKWTDLDLIEDISKNVNGAGYKVAACCVLYARGYHCGIIPVDSGIKDVLAPCLGLYSSKNAYGHEIVRHQLEKIVNSNNLQEIIDSNGYEIDIHSKTHPYTWFAHLIMINYKRYFCNTHKPSDCLLKNSSKTSGKIGTMCSKEEKKFGGYNFIFLEGCNGAGKTTIANRLKLFGFKSTHFVYDENTESVYDKYHNLITNFFDQRIVFDRSFISEYIYGNAYRKKSRVSELEINKLIDLIKENNGCVIYLDMETNELISRIKNDRVQKKNREIEKVTATNSAYKKFYENKLKKLGVIKITAGKRTVTEICDEIIYNI